MSIITFWSDGTAQTGQTSSIAAISTWLSIENTYKTLVFNAKGDDEDLHNCFWTPQKESKFNFRDSKKTDLDTGTTGVAKAILSGKTSPEIITNYTSTIFKGRLELLTDKKIPIDKYIQYRKIFKDLVGMANSYYDFVFVDLDGDINDPATSAILEKSTVIVLNVGQNLSQIKNTMKLKRENSLLSKEKTIICLGNMDKNSKYNPKNVAHFMGEKDVLGIPHNTLFMESCNEGMVADYFIKFRKAKKTDENGLLVEAVKKATDGIIYRVKELQMKI